MYFIDSNFRHIVFSNNSVITFYLKLGSVVGPVIQANGRLKFEDDLRLGGLLYIPQRRVPSASSSGSLGFIVYV
jgi:hypothetical protein